jgi:hypothetical protein
MKKMYVVPAATGVSFIVNENIATSGKMESAVGVTGFTQQKEGLCNDYFYGTKLPTNLDPGSLSVWGSLAGLSEDQLKDLLAYVESIKPEE